MAREGSSPASVEQRKKVRRPRIGTFSSLRHRDFRFLWTGNFFNNGANWLQQVTVGWLVWDLSHSAFLVESVGGRRWWAVFPTDLLVLDQSRSNLKPVHLSPGVAQLRYVDGLPDVPGAER
jgi:hypothetical protein